LQDGSMVYLNAASRLRYPTSFTDTDRVVELLGGEISLQVEKDTARPFIVHCQGQQVKVLGTQFNIKAYKNSVDSAITTTLFEGSIQINGDNQQITLKPGQSCVNRQGQLSILVDSLSDVNAWRNSFFTFHNKPLSSIMDEVARWYGVSVRYEHQKQDVPFTITEFNRKDSLKDLLTDLQASRLVRFRMEGKKIVISKF
jgi:transmembrane sensor